MAELSNEQKSQIIQTHIQSVIYNQYNLQISILEEQAKKTPDQAVLSSLNAQQTDCTNQLTALNAELSSVSTPSA